MIIVLRAFMRYNYYNAYKNLKNAGNIEIKTANFDLVFNASYLQLVNFNLKCIRQNYYKCTCINQDLVLYIKQFLQ